MHRNAPQPSGRSSRWRRRLKRMTTLFFIVAVSVLLYLLLKDVQWREVHTALQGYTPATLALGVGLAALSYLVFASYDLVGRYYTAHQLAVNRVVSLAFVCYAFNLNFGAWIGGLALRYRLYSRFGLGMGTVTAIVTMSLLTNWLGYMLVAGGLFFRGLLSFPDSWWIDSAQLRWAGLALLVLALGYFLLCACSRHGVLSWRQQRIALPSLRLALTQALLGVTNWGLMASLIYLLLPDGVGYPTVLAILMVSSIAGAITHIPGGIGILEAVFLGLLQGQYAAGDVLAALIVYRGIYFLLPLAVAGVTYLMLEKKAATLRAPLSADSDSPSAASLAAGENQ